MVEPMKTKRSYSRLLVACMLLVTGASVATAQTGADATQAAAESRIDMSKLTHEQIANVQVATVAEQLLAMYRSSGDSERALWTLERLSALRPNVGRLRFDLALAYAARGEKTKTYDLLVKMQGQGYGYDLAKDARFAKVADTPVWDYIVKNLQINLDPFGEGEVAFELPNGDHLYESIAWDPKRKDFLVGSVRDGTISRVGPKGGTHGFIAPDADNGLWSVYALDVDAEHDVLYTASTASVYFKGLDKTDFGKAGVFKFRLSDGKLLDKYLLPVDGSPHTLSSLAVGKDGNVYVADGVRNEIWRLDGGALKLLWKDPRLVSIRGLAASGDGKRLYFADHALGVFGIDLARGSAFDLRYDPDSLVLGGVDGLYWYDGTLVVIQNDMQPKRIMRLSVAEDGRTITKAMPLDASKPELTLPTTGTIGGDKLYFIANSQKNEYGTYGSPRDAGKLEAVKIYRSDLRFAWDQKGITTELQALPTATPEQREEFLKRDAGNPAKDDLDAG
jgi:sugar lactone lactonase YvrE